MFSMLHYYLRFILNLFQIKALDQKAGSSHEGTVALIISLVPRRARVEGVEGGCLLPHRRQVLAGVQAPPLVEQEVGRAPRHLIFRHLERRK